MVISTVTAAYQTITPSFVSDTVTRTQAGPIGALAANAFFRGGAAGDADGNGARPNVEFGSVAPSLAMTANQFAIV